jgi:hypothetical protein
MGQTNTGGQVGMSRGEQHQEGTIAKTIEQQTAKVPSDVFLWAAMGSIGASALLQVMGKKQASLFVGDRINTTADINRSSTHRLHSSKSV